MSVKNCPIYLSQVTLTMKQEPVTVVRVARTVPTILVEPNHMTISWNQQTWEPAVEKPREVVS